MAKAEEAAAEFKAGSFRWVLYEGHIVYRFAP